MLTFLLEKILPVLSLLFLLGCAQNGSKEEAAGETSNTDELSTPGYVQLFEKVFASGCAAGSCHDGDQGIAGLSFANAEASYQQLLDVPTSNPHANEAGMLRVKPGDPDASFLLTKLTWKNNALIEAGFGAPMPMGGIAGPGPDSVDAIRRWIKGGAPFEGADFDADTAAPVEEAYIACDASDEEGLKACFPPPPTADSVTRLYTPKMEIPAASEILICSPLTANVDFDILVKGAQGLQMEGGHHVAIYVRDAASEEDPHECSDTDMLTLRFVVGAGGAGAVSTQLPPGTALRIQAGQQIVIQSHYINTKPVARTVMDAVDLLMVDPETEPLVADALVIHHSNFSIPPFAVDHEAVNECTIQDELDVHLLLGHTHDFGVFLQLEHIDDEGHSNVLYTGYDGPLMRDDPEILLFGEDPLHLSAGDKLRITCKWSNPGAATLGFPEEMCVAFMYYTPASVFLICDANDEFPVAISGTDDDPGEGCADIDELGNELGIGKFCTPSGTECSDNGAANFCLANFDPASNFCSIVFCTTEEQCGEGATCYQDDMGSACVPDACL